MDASRKECSSRHSKSTEHGKSPSTSSQHRLQGSARVVKDHCADWHNYIEKWNDLNDKGFNLINKIINLKLAHRKENESNVERQMSGGSHSEYPTNDHDEMPEGLEDLCNQLTDIYTTMASLMGRMSAVTRHFQGVKQLEERKSSGMNAALLFMSWPISQFVKASEDLETMYKQELEVKRTIVEDVAHRDDRDTMMMYASCWLHQPYIEDEATVILESMLTETGFR